MDIRAYLRASTKDQDAGRAESELVEFVKSECGRRITATYRENESGATLERPELIRLIKEASEGDVILVEQIDRLARLNNADWEMLKRLLAEKRLLIVSKELPTSWQALKQCDDQPDFTVSMLQSINAMLLDMLALIARKDYDDRRKRQQQGIAKAKVAGKYKGRVEDISKQDAIEKMLSASISYSQIQETLGCSRGLIAKVSKRMQDPVGA